ncbi:polysaccharide pyruvyl transferase family protein [Flavobacterium sp. GA093]|uniref:Polysaccharide pyruvyl transferase family protein n=1 Tax=Flavobacterium hydrocarbonoxydans TaxID=2683249 RepID=A0A6I4NS60_9FLAO|nr:polysaccharide pyruvyl transferase family protein [Flavobacterium hydrocarbonoxydans]MWB94509.1 polysaccharide pyruvyl transferase family protein [Flavobacterium hydrocarbonoxydans]
MKIIFLYWCSLKRSDHRDNYGDLLSKYIIKKLSKGIVIKVKYPSSRIYNFFVKNYISIGSIINTASVNTIVWGSGIIKKNDNVRNARFLAVRGPLTRKRIIDLGYEAPEVYGDPAILLPILFKNNQVVKKFEIGIIPHYVDFEEVQDFFKNESRIKVIDLLTLNVETTTNEILECSNIISSSLHGLIVSHSYNIPAMWNKFSNKLSGDNIKFYDYFESVGINYSEELANEVQNLSFEFIKNLIVENKEILLPNKELLEFRQNELLKACPFNK